MIRRLALFAFVSLLLAGCGGGGGGGGGGGAAPSSLNPVGEPTNPTVGVNVGIFSDAPVAGLKYRQGGQEGFTDAEGKFHYDAGSNVPMEFLVGHTSLGFAKGAGMITPFDLNGTFASTNRGLNVSRMLITLDVDGNPDNGIELPESTRQLVAELPFDMEPGAFEEDQQVASLLNQVGIQSLVDMNAAQQHIVRNLRIQEQLEENTRIVEQVKRLNIEFDAGLISAGLLAHISADSGEQLYLFANPQLPGTISSALYIDVGNGYYFLRFDSAGFVRYVNANGAKARVVTNTIENTMPKYFQLLDLPNYRGSAENVLVSVSGGASSPVSVGWNYSSITAIASALSGFSEGQLTASNIVQIGATVMSAVHQMRCGAVNSCQGGTLLQKVLDHWLVDQDFANRVTSVQSRVFDLAGLCLTFSSLNDGPLCGSQTSLASVISHLDGVSITDLAMWNSQMTRLPPRVVVNGTGSFMSLKISSDKEVASRGSIYEWSSSRGPVPEPWVEASATIGMQFDFRRLSEDKLYFELQSGGVYIDPLTINECRYVFREISPNGVEVYRRSCQVMDRRAGESQAILDLINDLHSVAFNRSGLLYKQINLGIVTYRSYSDADAARVMALHGGPLAMEALINNYVATLLSERHISGHSSFSVGESVRQTNDSMWYFSQSVEGDIVDSRMRNGKLYFDLGTATPVFAL